VKSAELLRALSLAVLSAALALASVPAARAAEFRSVAGRVAVLYDAPSVKSKKLFVASQFYPVEIIVNIDNWVKVRDASGELAWMEKRDLSERRTLLVKAATLDVRQAAEDSAPIVFQARQGVVLDLAELGASGWVRVRHQDGASGFVRASQVWGL
jgi:SH3-like domain-containing protein